MTKREVGRSPNSAAAHRWLSTEPGPHARTAAIQRPWTETSGCPTAYAHVQPMQAPRPQPVLYAETAHAQRQQLPVGNDTMLPTCQRGYLPVTWATSWAYSPGK